MAGGETAEVYVPFDSRGYFSNIYTQQVEEAELWVVDTITLIENNFFPKSTLEHCRKGRPYRAA